MQLEHSNDYGMGNGLLLTLGLLMSSIVLQVLNNVETIDKYILIGVHIAQGFAAIAAVIVAYVTVKNGRKKKRNKDVV